MRIAQYFALALGAYSVVVIALVALAGAGTPKVRR